MSTDSDSEAYLTARSSEREDSVDLELALDRLDISSRPRKRLRVLIQDACRLHKYARDSDISGIVERPERLRAVNMGLAAVWARRGGDAAEAMAAQMSRLALGNTESRSGTILSGAPFEVVSSNSRLPLTSKAVAFVHNESNQPPATAETSKPVFPGPAYPQQLSDWIQGSTTARETGQSEVPAHLPQGDLYLCPGSLAAVEGALGTTCAAVDEAMAQSGVRFAAIRPPGHHCSTAIPSGFCLVNNVLVGAAHAYEKYDCDRVVIFDIDLHHGDGTQDIAHRINAESAAIERAQASKTTPRKAAGTPRSRRSPSPQRSAREKTPASEPDDAVPTKRPLKILYTSLHDIESFPCEDGDDDRITNASMRILGGHGHWICNVHLEAYESESDFHANHYAAYRSELFKAASTFLQRTAADPARTLIFISAGFDASEHETPFMQRHGKRVPTSFFSRFAADAQAFAAEHAGDRLVAVLEGGYSDRALLSGAASFLDGFLDHHSALTTAWDAKTLVAVERAYEGRAATRGSSAEPWIGVAQSAFCALEGLPSLTSTASQTTTPTGPRELRERKPKPPTLAEEQASPRRPNGTSKARAVTQPAPQQVKSEPVDKSQTTEGDYVLPQPAIGNFKLTFKAGGIA